MVKKAARAKYKDRFYNIVLRVRGSMKNDIMDAAKKNGMTLTEYVLYCTWEHIRSERGIPQPGSAQFSLPDPAQEIQAYFAGIELLQPCGKRSCDMVITEFQGMKFCETCNIRVE